MESPASRLSNNSMILLGAEYGESFLTQDTGEQGRGSSGRSPAGRDENLVHLQSKATQHDGAARNKSSSRPARGRQNSLRHVKNSNDLLRQRSLRDKKAEVAPDANPGGREGRHFTVGNVGTNGLIYLRPVINPSHKRRQPSQFVLPPITPPSSARLEEDESKKESGERIRQSVWSNSQWSEITPKRPTQRVDRNTPSDTPTSGPSHSRAHSFSTVDDSRTSSLKPGVFRIVIDRSESKRPKTAEQLGNPALPTLEVPIPHYRLGTPRFSEQGTPVLRSSVYTRTSVSDNFRHSTFARGDYEQFPVPPSMGSTERPPQGLGPSPNSFQPNMIRTTGMSGVTMSSAALPSPVLYKFQESIEPEIFESLTFNMNDPSVVRFSLKTGEITAASPARIVAQISSDSFMDYELVSDFFLTFRSYLSTQSLLGLLLARLHWAINRLQEDGRIIRIRTFAALRHWILNYFVDDFVVNRDLRILFCEKINAMYRDVRDRSNGNNSDLKILLDLKRCWNGRCALYWDAAEFFMDGQPDAEIIPGGVAGSRESRLSRLYSDTPPVPSIAVQVESASNSEEPRTVIQTWFGEVAKSQAQTASSHERQASDSSAEMPLSPTSDQSIQVVSCSFPPIGFKRSASPLTRSRGPHPVLVPAGRASPAPPTAPLGPAPTQAFWRKPTHAHKRSGSFSDAVRDDRDPLPSPKRDKHPQHTILMAFPHAGSLIRGNVYPPAAPYIDVLAPHSPPGHLAQFDLGPGDPSNTGDSSFRASPNGNNGYKSLFGSIRRALSSRQSGSHHASHTPASAPSMRGKTSALPLNVAVQPEAPREKRRGHGARSQMRIDLLCADVMHSYKSAVKRQEEGIYYFQNNIGLALGNEREQPSPAFVGDTFSADDQGMKRRLPSQVTTGSKSIVIVDDTGLDMPSIPAMSGALNPNPPVEDLAEEAPLAFAPPLTQSGENDEPRTVERQSKSTMRTQPTGRSSSLDRGLAELDKESMNFQHSRMVSQDGSFHFGRSSSLNRGKRVISEGRTSSSLRKYASYQSGIAKHGTKPSLGEETTWSGAAEVSSSDVFDKPPARMLRRRPGGDLRNIQNVHDLEPIARPQSTGSATTCSDSVGGSVLYMAKNRNVGAPQPFSPMSPEFSKPKSPRLSLIRTHSSQHMRPSFEAAVAGFSTIPDDTDGGIEATLLKLEGVYVKPSPQQYIEQETLEMETSTFEDTTITDVSQLDGAHDSVEKRKHRHKKVVQDGISETPEPFQDSAEGGTPTSDQPDISHSALPRSISPMFAFRTASVAESEDSYSSVPLLERGLSDQLVKSKTSPVRSDVSVPRPLFSRNASESNPKPESSHPSLEVVEETDSMRRIQQGSTIPNPSPLAESFLLDEDENLTDISSELSVEFVDASEAVDNPLGFDSGNLPRATILGVNSPLDAQRHPPSPPTTMDNPLSINSQVNPMAFQSRPLTPDPSPTTRSGPFGQEDARTPRTDVPRPSATPVPSPGHLPFILACDSETLAQQFVVVERAALTEIDWKDLVEMRWATRQPAFQNWVQFLTVQDHKGVDLVIARFNLVVKWALSEIVMTKDINERARTIMKYIHIAARSRQLRNYATMLQLTIALTSIDCTRLVKSWELVPPTEVLMLQDLEKLIQPVRNFHDLRVEMETADLQHGCIPFVGLYVHDLTYNAQKPAQIASTRNGDPLVNFERYRRAATIVKSLLRLVDSSSRYPFQPVEGVVERCLWIAALSDEKIQAMSQGLE